ncbi:MAG TPA: TolC family protein [Kiritimatiellia bacterium]|nr:TolC family protein [Kiritimatiellia bacterium]
MTDVRLTPWAAVPALALGLLSAGCRTPADHRRLADENAARVIQSAREDLQGAGAPVLVVERPADTLRRRLLIDQESTPGAEPPASPAANSAAERLTLVQALAAGAQNNNEYQARKEAVFRAALRLNVAEEGFANSWAGVLVGEAQENRSGDDTVRGVSGRASPAVQRLLRGGALVSAQVAVDLVKLLTLEKPSSLGLVADLSVTVPLLRGAGRAVVTEPLTQAERNLVYALLEFERFKQAFVVRVASQYFGTMEQQQRARNARDNLERLRLARQLAESLGQSGRLPEIQVDQARQDELRARERLLQAESAVARSLDELKLTLGLPVDAEIEIDPDEIQRFTDAAATARTGRPDAPDTESDAAGEAGPYELDVAVAIGLALERRPDLTITRGRLEDARRALVVAEDALRAGLKLEVKGAAGESRSYGSADRDDAELRPDRGVYTARLTSDLPWRRVDERRAYREQLLAIDEAERAVEQAEDQVKAQVRDNLRALALARESYRIQQLALDVAQRRVESSEMFLQAGRVQIRDVLEAQEALLNALNAVTAVTVNYRLAELALQRDMAVLEVDDEGRWREFVINE